MRLVAVLATSLSLIALLAAPSQADIPPPSGETSWHYKQFSSPNGHCYGKLGISRNNGWVKVQARTDCINGMYAATIQLYVQRNDKLLANPDYHSCYAMTGFFSCTMTKSYWDPAGSQHWYIYSLNTVTEGGNSVLVPRFDVYM